MSGQRSPAAHRAAGYQRMNMPFGGVIPYARLPGFRVGSAVVTALGPPVPVADPLDPNLVPRNAPGSPIAYRFPYVICAVGATGIGVGVATGVTTGVGSGVGSGVATGVGVGVGVAVGVGVGVGVAVGVGVGVGVSVAVSVTSGISPLSR